MWVDEESPGDALGDAAAHLSSCADCRETVAALRGIDEIVSGAARVLPPPSTHTDSCLSPDAIARHAPGAPWDAHLSGCVVCTHLLAQARAAADGARAPSRRRTAPLAAAAALLACAGAAWFLLAGPLGSDDLKRLGVVEVATASTLLLRDGTSLDLGAGASVEDVPPGAGERRRVRLRRGAVLARVSPATSGFVLETPAAVVRVVGTRFEVRAASLPTGEPAAAVRVFEGRVEVTAGGRTVPLGVGWSAYAVPGDPPLVQEGGAARGPEALERLQEEYRSAAATDRRARHARWLAAILATSECPPPAGGEGR